MNSYWFDFLFIVIEGILLLFGLYTDLAAGIFGSNSAAVDAIFPYQFFLLISYITLKMVGNSKSSQNALDEIKRQTKDSSDAVYRFLNTKAEAVAFSTDMFYSELEKCISSAQKFVGITHLDLTPPEHLPGTSGHLYYERLESFIKEQTRVIFQRVERATPEKKEWIEKLVQTYEGARNYSLSCYLTNETTPTLPAISVQVIDDDKVFLVAVSRQQVHHGAPRDFFIKDPTIHELWQSYYDNILFNGPNSIKVIERGRLNRQNLDRVMQHIEEAAQ